MKIIREKSIGKFAIMINILFFVSFISFSMLRIQVYASTVSENTVSGQLTLQETEAVTGAVTDIDLGDYSSTMTVGEKQLLSVTILPQTLTSPNIVYSSDNESVVTINAMGRISAISVGKAKITVSCGNIVRSFDLTVKETEDSKDIKINVSDIEISNDSNELEINKTLNLSATVLPADATDSKLTYSTSNSAIATVSSTGVIKGVSSGNVEIIVNAGGFSKKITILVKAATVSIKLNTNYLVLKKGDSFQLEGNAVPEQAKQTISYKSADETIASVTQEGKVTAKDTGNTTILVTNGDMTNAVTVIVNASGVVQTSVTANEENNQMNISEQETSFKNLLEQNNQIEISSEDYPLIKRGMLKSLYESKKVMVIKGSEYTLILDGKEIVNYNNQLDTKLKVAKTEKGLELVLNDNQNLPGSVLLKMTSENENEYNYMYLYNAVKDKYQMIKTDNLSNIKIDTAGKYLLTEKKLNGMSFSIFVIIGFVLAVIILAGIYIGVKKKHWFW